MDKTSAFEFWKKKLKSAKYVIAPMVDQSELPWRLLSRKYGAELCYTPMFHASVFIRDPNYRTEALQSCAEDHPLITQFCANDPETLLKAAQYVETFCEAVDLNLGCPQVIARKGHYGAFLQDEWDLIHKMVSLCHSKLKIPITCKIRVFESIEKTVEYAKMLENAGCQLLTVHGRTREQKGALTGIADWAHIKAVKENVKIPVFGNGNIQYLQDVHRCIKETGVDGVMSAEGNLHNPAIFRGIDPPVWQMAEEYLEFVEKYPCSISYVRGHLFKMLHHALVVHNDVREMVGVGKTVGCFKEAVEKLKIKCQVDVERYKVCPDDFVSDRPLPYWICQPYVRLNPEERKKNENRERRENQKRHIQMRILAEEFVGLSNNKIKKMMKKPNRCFDPEKRVPFEICQQCPNTKGQKCDFSLCKVCCKLKTKQDILDCEGHNFMVRSRSNGGLIENLKPQRVSVGDDVNNLAISTTTAIQKVTIDSHMQKISNGTDLVVIGDSTTRDTTHESDLLGIKSNS